MNKLESDRIWREARTLRQLGEATAQLLEGRLKPRPTYGYCVGIFAETKPLVTVLASFNRRSGQVMTLASQPGQRDQRAYVEGLATPACCRRLERFAAKHGLVFDAGLNRGLSTHQEVHKDGAIVWNCLTRREIKQCFQGLHADALLALQSCLQFHLVDTEWDRNSVLWPALRKFR